MQDPRQGRQRRSCILPREPVSDHATVTHAQGVDLIISQLRTAYMSCSGN